MCGKRSMMLVPAVILALAWMIGQAAAQETTAAPADGDEEYLLRGPLHEAFAEPVTFDPQPGLVVPNGAARAGPGDAAGSQARRRCRVDFRATGPGTTSARIIFGSPAFTACFRRANAAVPGYWRQAGNGYQWVPGFWTPAEAQQVEYLPPPPRVSNRAPQPSPLGGSLLDQRVLGIRKHRLSLAAGLLGGRARRLGVGARFLCLDTVRLHLRARLLGLPARESGHVLRSGLLSPYGPHPAGILLQSPPRDRSWPALHSPLRAARLLPLLLRRLVRFAAPLRHLRLVQFSRASRIRSNLVLRSLALPPPRHRLREPRPRLARLLQPPRGSPPAPHVA